MDLADSVQNNDGRDMVDNDKKLGTIISNYIKTTNTLPTQMMSSLNHLSLNIDTDPNLLEAFALGMMLSPNIDLKSELYLSRSVFHSRMTDAISQREWSTFNNNVLLLLDASAIPHNIKQKVQNFEQLMKYVDLYYPQKFYPKVHVQKGVLDKLKINNLDDIINFNHQFKIIFNHLISSFESGTLFKKISEIDVDNLIKIFDDKRNKKTIKINSINKIYSDTYAKSKLLSIDMVQANATVYFVYCGKKLFMDEGLQISDMGLGLEKYFSTWEEFLNNFNWSYYVKAQLNSTNIKVVNEGIFDILCSAFISSKMAREIILGVMAKKKTTYGNHTIEKILDLICKSLLCDLLITIEPIILFSNATIVSFTMDEITIKNLSYDKLMNYLALQANTGVMHIYKKYLRIEEFILEQHKLGNGKKFYAKYYTNNAIPSIKYISPDSKIEALHIVEEKWYTIEKINYDLS